MQQLLLLEQRSQNQETDLYYGDETQISEQGYVPYGWQFRDENVCIEAATGGKKLNCFGIITRDNVFSYKTTQEVINTHFVIEHLDRFSYQITKQTVIVLDNAKVHQSKTMLTMQQIWIKRGLFIFYLPPYSPHLNIIERVWKELKARWLKPIDYTNDQQLFYAANLVLNAIGNDLSINFTK